MRHRTAQQRATALRLRSTDAERRLWFYLRRKHLRGFRFRRQVPIGPFIVDFACHEARLAIELDGGQHLDNREYDETREAFVRKLGWRVLRFWDDDVLLNVAAVLEVVSRTLPPSQPSPVNGGRNKSEP